MSLAPGVSRCTKFDPLSPEGKFGQTFSVEVRMPLAFGLKLFRFTRENRALDSHFMRFFWTMRAKEHELLMTLGVI